MGAQFSKAGRIEDPRYISWVQIAYQLERKGVVRVLGSRCLLQNDKMARWKWKRNAMRGLYRHSEDMRGQDCTSRARQGKQRELLLDELVFGERSSKGG